MATITPYSPDSAITRAMFNFDATGGTDFVLTGPVTVTVSDRFVQSDITGTNILPDLATTSGTAEFDWQAAPAQKPPATIADGVSETLDIIKQFANVDLHFIGDTDTIGANATPNPADVGKAGIADIDVTVINNPNVDWVGISGAYSDDLLGYAGSAGDVFINRAFLSENDFTIGTPSRTTLMHELLHSLGLSHPHSDYINGVPTITADYAATQSLGFDKLGFHITSAMDMYKEYFTIMSYDDGNVFQESHTPQILDVIALQQAYGEGSGTTGSGDDTIQAGNAGYRVYFDTGGTDTIDLSLWSTGVYLNMGVTITGAAHLVGVAMSRAEGDNLANAGPTNLRWFYGEFENASGSAADDKMVGNVLDNDIKGLAGNDRLFGGGGNDTLEGGAGADILNGGPGDDTLLGGAGSDSADYSNAKSGVTVNLSLSGPQDTGGAGTDTLSSIEGLLGSAFADRLTGNAVNNVLKGGAGNDVLSGLAGNDTLVGGAGNDTLRGGPGHDTFVFDKASAGGIDKIADFLFKDDTIDLDHALFTKLTSLGTLGADNFRENTSGTARDPNDFIVYDTRTGALSYDPDGNGARHAVQFATLFDGVSSHPGATEISHLDFVII